MSRYEKSGAEESRIRRGDEGTAEGDEQGALDQTRLVRDDGQLEDPILAACVPRCKRMASRRQPERDRTARECRAEESVPMTRKNHFVERLARAAQWQQRLQEQEHQEPEESED